MLEQIMRQTNNWFATGIYTGKFEIKNGSITLPFLRSKQYFRVVGSVFNDGVYQYPAGDLEDEAFEGAIWALAVPKAIVSLSEEVAKWQERNGEAALSPYTSESFGGYSYSKGDGSESGWESTFKSKLDCWRRLGSAVGNAATITWFGGTGEDGGAV